MVDSIQPKAHNPSAPGSVESILKQHHFSEKGHPFITFYLLIMNKMMGSQTKAETQSINKFAGQLKNMSKYLGEWENIKIEFDGAENGPNFHQFSQACGKLLNDIFGNVLKEIGLPPFNANGFPLNQDTFKSFVQYINLATPTFMAEYCPTLGIHAQSLLKNMDSFSIYFTTSHSLPHPDGNLSQVWANAKGLNDPHGMPQPEILQGNLDNLSEGNGLLTGVSGVESSTLQMKQQSYNRLQSFIKSMLSDWSQMKKSFNASMSQANN